MRDLARQSVGDTGLLDYVLKGLGGKKMGGYVFRREVNQVRYTACLANLRNSQSKHRKHRQSVGDKGGSTTALSKEKSALYAAKLFHTDRLTGRPFLEPL